MAFVSGDVEPTVKRYETPAKVASVLARHAPRSFQSLLEPAVGNGVLLLPLLKKLESAARVVCIDCDGTVLPVVESLIGSVGEAKRELVQADFIAWSLQKEAGSFDLVIANPPFGAKKADFVPVLVTCELQGKPRRRSVPLEIAFLIRAIELLKDGGRLLAIVPTSAVSTPTTEWFRKWLRINGSVKYVHELPSHTFGSVESRIYLLVFDKGIAQSNVTLQNHDLVRPESLIISKETAAQSGRLDYRYHQSSGSSTTLSIDLDLNWISFGSCAEMVRGGVKSPVNERAVVHTTNCNQCIWKRQPSDAEYCREPIGVVVRAGDLLVKRVGRRCSQSLGAGTEMEGLSCSDCVLVVRPSKKYRMSKLLFAARTVLGFSWAQALIERGTGATYITLDSLKMLKIPIKLAEQMPELYRKYCSAVARNDIPRMAEIEESARARLMKRARLRLARK